MEWTSFIPLLAALLVAIGMPLAIRSLRKSGRSKAEEFVQALKAIGVDATLEPEETGQGQARRKRSWGQTPLGRIKLQDSNIDLIDIVGVASQYGVNYYVDYLVSRPRLSTASKKKKTSISTRKTSLFGGKVTDVRWKGDEILAQRLNYDYGVKSLLLQTDLSAVRGGGISIHPEPKREHARIRTGYGPPDANLFKALDTIARHVKSWY